MAVQLWLLPLPLPPPSPPLPPPLSGAGFENTCYLQITLYKTVLVTCLLSQLNAHDQVLRETGEEMHQKLPERYDKYADKL